MKLSIKLNCKIDKLFYFENIDLWNCQRTANKQLDLDENKSDC
jgi:hypothetical protein